MAKKNKKDARKDLVDLIVESAPEKNERIRGLGADSVIYDEVNVLDEPEVAAEEPQDGDEAAPDQDAAQGANSTSEAAHVAPAKQVRPLQTAAKLGHILQGKSRRVRKYIPFSTKH